jgi:hypothetical protein
MVWWNIDAEHDKYVQISNNLGGYGWYWCLWGAGRNQNRKKQLCHMWSYVAFSIGRWQSALYLKKIWNQNFTALPSTTLMTFGTRFPGSMFTKLLLLPVLFPAMQT